MGMRLTQSTLEGWLAWRDRHAVDTGGHRLGRIVDIYLDRRLERPTWALVDLGDRSAFAPLHKAAPHGAALRLDVEARAVRKAPTAPAGREMTAPMEAMLRRHYEETGLRNPWERPPWAEAPAARPAPATGTAGHRP
jgi:hypothetical protein